jgi:hypothetical protein
VVVIKGQPCTQDDWGRQFIKGLKKGEKACLETGGHKEALPVQPTKSEDYKNRKYICRKLREKRFADMTPNDLKKLELCVATGL